MITIRFEDAIFTGYDCSPEALERLYKEVAPFDTYDVFVTSNEYGHVFHSLFKLRWWGFVRRSRGHLPKNIRLHIDQSLKDSSWYVLCGPFKITCKGA